uniref:Uncharacterized protein n=1 Tax=Avena sativa TaxID=4498 RepID=A0ACD5THH0_AVESA
MRLRPLKIQSHGASSNDMPYDERYTEYIKRLGLLPFITLVSRSTPNLNAAAITALVDRWRPETHTFHLRTGEITPTLQDVSMIFGLPIAGEPLCMSTDSDGWRNAMELLIGMAPEELEDKSKDRVPAGATYAWIVENFRQCPNPAEVEVIETHARVYVWYVLSRTLFADSGGRTAQWMWLKALANWDSNISWGSAALAYLYRQLDDACRRAGENAGIGGAMVLLSIWSWERLPVGRPKEVGHHPWPAYNRNPLRQPTWAYKWDVVSEMTSDVDAMYLKYTNEFDAITPEQVGWEPYGCGDEFGIAPGFDINPKCLEEQSLWLMCCPLICNWAIEFHMPQRVMRQFGLFQCNPPVWKDTDKELHRLDRKRKRKIKNWDHHHRRHVMDFLICVENARQTEWNSGRAHCPVAFNNYIHWFLGSTRVSICPPSYEEEILEEPVQFDELSYTQYNRQVRRGTDIPLSSSLNFARTEVKKYADDAEAILFSAPKGKKGEGMIRNFLKRSAQKMRRLSNVLGCRDPKYTTPSGSRSKSTTDPSAHLQDDVEDDTTSANRSEDELPHMENETEEEYRIRSAYQLKPRKQFNRWTPDDFRNKGKANVVEDEPPRRSRATRRTRGLQYDDEDESQEEEVTKKIPPRRGRGPRTRGRK